MTTAPNKSPLDVARDYCGKNPTALPTGRYKVVDRVDRREPSPETMTDSGTDKLLARAAAVKDTAEISPAAKAAAPARDMTLAEAEAALYEHTRLFTIRLERAWAVYNQPRTTEWSVCCCRDERQSFRLFSANTLRAAVVRAIDYMRPDPLPTSTEVSDQIDIDAATNPPTPQASAEDLYKETTPQERFGDLVRRSMEQPEPFCESTGPMEDSK